MDSIPRDFAPVDVLAAALRWWWVIVVSMLVGAVLGWGFSFFKQPVYEARATLSSGIDYVHTGKLTELEEDKALEIVGDVMLSTSVVDNVLSAAKTAGIEMDAGTFFQIAYRERSGREWLICVRSTDSVAAARLANIWQQEAYKALNEALRHAILVDQLEHRLDVYESCLSAIASQPAHAYCDSRNLANIQSDLQKSGADILREKSASQGIISALTFGLVKTAEPPQSPVLYGRSVLVLSGAVIGLILASGWIGLIMARK